MQYKDGSGGCYICRASHRPIQDSSRARSQVGKGGKRSAPPRHVASPRRHIENSAVDIADIQLRIVSWPAVQIEAGARFACRSSQPAILRKSTNSCDYQVHALSNVGLITVFQSREFRITIFPIHEDDKSIEPTGQYVLNHSTTTTYSDLHHPHAARARGQAIGLATQSRGDCARNVRSHRRL